MANVGSERGEEKMRLSNGDENSVEVDISDALCEQERVVFTVQARGMEMGEAVSKFKVVRSHEDFLWLHSVIEENPAYAGLIIPPRPPRPDFQATQERLTRMGEKEARGGREQFAKVKQDLEADYLAAFKKTVAQHEGFLKRLASHNILKKDLNLRVFLEYEEELGVRGKNVKEKISEFFGIVQKSSGELLLASTQHDGDAYFEAEKVRLVELHSKLRTSCIMADKMSSTHKALANTSSHVAARLAGLLLESPDLSALDMVPQIIEKIRRIESRVANDQELKLADTLRFHMRDTSAAKDLLYRRLKALAAFEAANKELDFARSRNRDREVAETRQKEAWAVFEGVTEEAKVEIELQKERRVEGFQRQLQQLAELEIKHARAHCQVLREALSSLRPEE